MSFAGRLFYRLWHRPIGLARSAMRRGGPLAVRAANRGRLAMEAAALTLPPPPARESAHSFRVHLLTGRRFAYQSAFCLHTLARHCPLSITPEFYDDGTLDHAAAEPLLRLFPRALLHPHDELKERLERWLPIRTHPVLRERWLHYPHIRKLIDVHLGREGWRLVLDSDLLFWREPRLLLDWAAAPGRPLHATDCAENYGYPRELLRRLAGGEPPPLVNVGLCGLRSEMIDWDFLEHAASTLIATHGTDYYLEQALCALLMARSPEASLAAPAADYLTYPSPEEVSAPTAVMHHYVDLSRDLYHRHAWRTALTPTRRSAEAPAAGPASAPH